MAAAQSLPKEIFKAYDIRGIVDHTLTPDIVTAIGKALGSEAVVRGLSTIVIGRDGRLSGPNLSQALAQGIQSTGINVIDVGMVATPMRPPPSRSCRRVPWTTPNCRKR